MKKLLYYLITSALTIFALVVLFPSCEGPQGAQGLAGKDGTNGTNGKDGLNGKDANSSCLKCHTVANWTAKEDQYHLSKHYYGNTSARNTKWCARCHTDNGFKEIVGAGKFIVSNDIPNAVRINCSTCHAHSGFDFSGDTISQILTQTDPVKLNYNGNTTATDFGKINNLCVTCHQIRGVTAIQYIDSTGAVKSFNQLPFYPFNKAGQNDQATVKYQVGQSYAVHDGNQSNLCAGINGYEYAGQTYTRTWKHSANQCTDCHMNKYNTTSKTGGHTMIVNEAECTTCHGGADKIATTQALISAKLTELGELLTTRKVFKKTTNSSGVVSYSAVQTHDFYGTLLPNTASTTKYAITNTGGNTVSTTTGLVVYASKYTFDVDKDWALRIGREWKYGELGAAYNYDYVNSKNALGVHNPQYAFALLQKSIDWLKAN